MSLLHDILSNFYLSSWVSWIVFIHYIFRPFLLNSLPYENVIYRNQSLLCSICSSGTPFIKRIKKLFKILAVIINDILKMSALEIIEPQWNECLRIHSISRSPRDFNKLWYISSIYSETDFPPIINLIFWTQHLTTKKKVLLKFVQTDQQVDYRLKLNSVPPCSCSFNRITCRVKRYILQVQTF